MNFLVAPTVYPTKADYYLSFAGFFRGSITSLENLTVVNQNALVLQQKTITPQALQTDAIVSVNTMNQIISTLFKWTDANLQKTINLQFNGLNGNFTGDTELHTGAPNRVTVSVINGFGAPYTVRISEGDGYLLMNPNTGAAPSQKQRSHYQDIPVAGSYFFITPTEYGALSTNITLQIYDSSYVQRGQVTFTVNTDLNDLSDATGYPANNLLKVVVNRLNQIVNTLYYSLN